MAIFKTTAFSCVSYERENGETTYHVQRNYKNGKRVFIGRTYKTYEGALGMVRHRNSLYAEKHGSHMIEYKPRR